MGFANHNFFSLRPPQSTGRDPSGKKIMISFALVIIFVIFLFNIPHKTINGIKYIKIAGQDIKVELALTREEQEQGLSGRQSLGQNTGMLFVFDKPGRYDFWMPDMNFPIDIIWLDKNMKVIYIKKDARPELYPETYGPDQDAKYVLEVASGFSDKNNLKIGDSAVFTY